MKTEYIFPTILIALDVCAALPYAWLMVRMDFLRWVTAELKKEGKGDGAR